MEKLTKRDYYTAIKTLIETGSCDINDEDVITFCENEIDLLDKKAAKAKERAAAKKAEGDALADAVKAALSADEFESIPTIAAKIEDEDATVSKVTYRLSKLVANGDAVKQAITIPGVDGGKSRTVQGYKLA